MMNCCINREPIVTYEVKTAPTVPVITLSEAKQYMRVDYPDDDIFIGTLIDTAALYVQRNTGYAIGAQTITVFANSSGIGWLPLIPVTGTGVDIVGVNRFNTTYGTPVDMQVGYTAATIPGDIKLAILKLVATYYENREDSVVEGQKLGTAQDSSYTIIKALRRRVLL